MPIRQQHDNGLAYGCPECGSTEIERGEFHGEYQPEGGFRLFRCEDCETAFDPCAAVDVAVN